VKSIFEEKTTRKIDGSEVTRKGSVDDPKKGPNRTSILKSTKNQVDADR
jgi:hypothetical protein